MRKKVLNLLVIIILTVCVLILVLQYNSTKIRSMQERSLQEFEQNIVKTLGLKFVSNHAINRRKAYVRIIKDTIIGFNTGAGTDGLSSGFFFQSLNPISPIILIEQSYDGNSQYPEENFITYFKNGCMYFVRKLGASLHRICMDGSTKEYFEKYQDTMNFVGKAIIYRNKVSMLSTKGIYVFDLNTEKLLWKLPFDKPLEGFEIIPSVLINNRLYFYGFGNKINCLNLDNFRLEWQTKILKDSFLNFYGEYQELFYLYHTDKYIVLPGTKEIILIDIKTGSLIWKSSWGSYQVRNKPPHFDIVNNSIYFTNKKNVECIDLVNNKIFWRLKNAVYQGIYKDNVIATNMDYKYYLIIDKSTGALKSKIPYPNLNKPKNSDDLIDFIENNKYVIIGKESIYR